MKMPYALKKLRRMLGELRRGTTGIITRVATAEPVAALTFDDGPHPVFTPRLLDILERHQARATFFMIGQNAYCHPELVQRIGQAGHAIGNHSWDHAIFPLITGRKRRAQLRACARAIAPYGERLFRPPHGYYNVPSQLDVLWLGYRAINWSFEVNDWCSLDADRMAERLVSQTQPGSIILLHDGLCDVSEERFLDRRPMLSALDTVLERIGDRFRFVTLPELLQYGRAERQGIHWFKNPEL